VAIATLERVGAGRITVSQLLAHVIARGSATGLLRYTARIGASNVETVPIANPFTWIQ
jgi:hypothetical protein